MIQKKYSAVVSCGGLGTRLKKITKDIPKALFPINGKSTLERCIFELKSGPLWEISLAAHSNSFLDKRV